MLTKPFERDICQEVADYLAKRFFYTPDAVLQGDYWLSQNEVAEMLRSDKLNGDCEDFSMAAICGLAAHGVKARMILVWTEPPQNGYHALCESEQGYLIDNRTLGLVQTWGDEPQCRYTRDKMSGFFMQGELASWHSVKREEQT